MDLEKDQWIILKIQNLGATKDNNVPIANLKFKVDNGFLKYKGRMYLVLPVLRGKEYSRSTMLLPVRATIGFWRLKKEYLNAFTGGNEEVY